MFKSPSCCCYVGRAWVQHTAHKSFCLFCFCPHSPSDTINKAVNIKLLMLKQQSLLMQIKLEMQGDTSDPMYTSAMYRADVTKQDLSLTRVCTCGEVEASNTVCTAMSSILEQHEGYRLCPCKNFSRLIFFFLLNQWK